ncbi:MAG: adenosylcobalamin-dependent ribonucleoside-diphosphate reductase [Candidatus Latescibacterota bacterium]|jgi:ribonucleoside-diphosphate reductase alpha chain|nr:adenosylcobalamin-dependent ribonucleoside-diphosphate reductase [Candidatus Latescibacterota bacterium]MEE2726160.1 adenosylcobalamin-dependent ribonucleoside-diphosphate reductase [Candidatus Latescibacterota bacterium]
MASERIEDSSETATGVTNRIEDLLSQLEGHGLKRNGQDDLLARAAEAETYYGENDLAVDVLRSKYLAPGEVGPLHIWDRIARAMASVEKDKEYWYDRFFSLLMDFKFIPGGRVMHGAGRDEAQRKPTLSNCYVIPIEEDSLEGIYRCLSESAMVYRTGGGVGTDLSILRPQGAPVNATVDASPGCTAFMNLLSESTNAVSQAGRRGALMLTLRVDHPDIESFITIKNDANRTKVQYANISVLITHEFMQAVLADSDFDLRFEGTVYRTVRARELWNTIITNAHASAEPGIIFWDTMREYHNVEYANPLTSTNPCGEQPLASYTACNLGNLNLMKFVGDDGVFDHDALAEATRVATRFLDNVIEYNMDNHALPKIRDAVSSDRRVGLGITGMADALLLMKQAYDSEEALESIEEIMQTICHNAYETSIDLAEEKGAFSLFDWKGISKSKFVQGLPKKLQKRIKEKGLRNCTLITMPPVGTGSIVAQTSSGIEPIFCTSYKRRVKQHDGETFREYKVYHPLVKEVFGGDEDLPDYVRTAHQIDPYFRVRMQGVIQKYTDSSISSTINLPEDIDVETVADIYITAYKEGLKGVTVYREGSREGILQTEGQDDKKEENGGAETGGGTSADGFHHVRHRPAVTQGITERINTGEGRIYVTINEDEFGICEVFSTIGKAGGNAAAQSEAVSRLISLALRSGVDPREVVSELKGISGPNPVWENGELILSTPDAIGKAIERYVQRRAGGDAMESVVDVSAEPQAVSLEPPTQDSGNGVKTSTTCPECGSTVAHENSCLMCKHCGWSKC